MVMGFGCNVPAVMATRTLESDKDRMITILVNPLMSCTARLPVYALFTAAFFAANQGTVTFSLYVMGIILAVAMAKLFRRFLFPGESEPFVMELPPYRWPTLKGTVVHMWERGSLFLRKAGTVILAGSVAIWLLSYLPPGVKYGSGSSLAGMIGRALEPLVKPLGFDWRAVVALLFGFVAKEIVVSTYGALLGVGADRAAVSSGLQQIFTPLTAYCFMAFTLLYTPCLATVAVIRRETGSWKWAAFAVAYSLALAWLVAFVIYRVGLLFGLGR
jgi:ferrous iron transport protein B